MEKLVQLDHELQGFDDSTTFMEFAIKRKDSLVYRDALMRLQSFEADSDEEMQDGLIGILPFYFTNPTTALPKMVETMEGMPSSWALNSQRAADREMPTYLVDHLSKVEARTLIVVGREDPFCSARASEKAHLVIKGSELVILEGCGHFPWIEKRE